jgi:hypothetical protein
VSSAASSSAHFDHFVNSVPVLSYASSDSSDSHESRSRLASPRTPADDSVFPAPQLLKRSVIEATPRKDWRQSEVHAGLGFNARQWEDSSDDSFFEARSRPESRSSTFDAAPGDLTSEDEPPSPSYMTTPRAAFPATPRVGSTAEVLDSTVQSTLFGGFSWAMPTDSSSSERSSEYLGAQALTKRRTSQSAAPPPRPCKSPRRRPPPLAVTVM